MHNLGYIKLLAYKENLDKKKSSWFNIISYLTFFYISKELSVPYCVKLGIVCLAKSGEKL